MSLHFDVDESEGELISYKIKNKNIIMVGLTGSGKSSIIESLYPEKVDISRLSVKPITDNINIYGDMKVVNPSDRKDEYSINLFDTVGIGDKNVSTSTILRQIIEKMPEDLSKIHKIVFCFRMDRLRAKMSEDLTTLYQFFKMVGAKPDNFVLCLTFCDLYNNKTISNFWDEIKKFDDLPMTKEIKTIVYTSFPKLTECDEDPQIQNVLKNKIKLSKLRVFKEIIAKDETAFYPNKIIEKMNTVDFNSLVEMLKRDLTQKRHWFFGLFERQDQDILLSNLNKLRAKDEIVNKDSPLNIKKMNIPNKIRDDDKMDD